MSLEEKYDVFLSFRGADTRDGFTSHLYGGLCSKQIATYIDNEDLQKGDVIKPELLGAIEQSLITIVILSKNYAASVWCLDELQHILKCSKYIIPVFYGGVKPFHVRRQMGSFGDALTKHQTRYPKDRVDAWRSCLITIADRSGYDSEEIRPEKKLVEQIVQHVLKKLKRVTPSNPSLQGLFGIEDRVKHIMKGLLSNDTNSKDKPCQILGIWGMPGIGKSTLASVVFAQIHSEFEGSCYLDNVRVKFEKHGSMKYLLEKLVSKLLEDHSLKIETPFLESHVKARLKRKCVVFVLDDVSDPKQIEFLVGEKKKMFGHGSRIIITTRDKKVLDHIEVDKFEHLQGLQPRSRDAHQLFASHAFKGLDQPPAKEFEKLIEMALDYAKGVPLAIKVLGSLLHKRNKREWEDTLDKLKKESHIEIQKVLGISYEELDDNEKKIFLDIACFFKGKRRNAVESVLHGCGFYPSIGISALIDKSLIICDSNDQRLDMHDLNQDMGRDIVRKQYKDTRLWSEDEILDVFENDKGNEAIQSIYLENEKSSKIASIELSPKVFLKMSNLRLLRIGCKVKLPKGLEYLPNSLRYLNWDEYPLTCLPSGFVPKHLIKLKLSNSRIERLWEHSAQISGTHEEEEEEDPSLPFRYLEQLVGLDLEDCKCLKELPLNRSDWKSLEELNLSGCTSLSKLLVPYKVTWLNLSGTAIDEALESLFLALTCLKHFYLSNCKKLKRLPISFSKSKCLEEFYVDGCPQLKKFPEILEPMECLRVLDISRTGIKKLPISIENLIGLCRLIMNGCIWMVEIPSLPNGITYLDLSNCEMLLTIKELPSALRSLYLQNCKRLESLPDLPTSIRFLLADGCISLNQLPDDSIILSSNPEDRVVFFSQSNYSSEHFSFANCRNLSPYAYSLILCIALFRIWRKALKVLQYYESRLPPSKSSLLTGQTVDTSTNSIMICLPGSELPDWFSIPIMFQTNNYEGYSSVIVELNSDWYREEFMGFVLCVVASTDDSTENSYDTKDFHIQFDYCFRANDGKSLQGVPDFISMSDLHLSSVDHIFIGFEFGASYDAVKFARQGHVLKQVSFNFSLVSASTSEPLNHLKISKCGIGVIYGPEFLMDMIDLKDTTRAPDDEEPENVEAHEKVEDHHEKVEDVPLQGTHDETVVTSGTETTPTDLQLIRPIKSPISDPKLSPGVGNANNVQASSSQSSSNDHELPRLGRVGKWFVSNNIADNLNILVERDPDFLIAINQLFDFQATSCLVVVGEMLMLLSSKTLNALTDEDRAFLKATIPLLQIRNVYTPFLQHLLGQCIEDNASFWLMEFKEVENQCLYLLEEEKRLQNRLLQIRKQIATLQLRLAEISTICAHRWNKTIFPPPL